MAGLWIGLVTRLMLKSFICEIASPFRIYAGIWNVTKRKSWQNENVTKRKSWQKIRDISIWRLLISWFWDTNLETVGMLGPAELWKFSVSLYEWCIKCINWFLRNWFTFCELECNFYSILVFFRFEHLSNE